MDTVLFRLLNALAGRSEYLDAFIVFCAVYLWYWMAAAVFAFFVFSFLFKFRHALRRNGEMLLLAASSAFAARFVIVEVVRLFFNRPRPFELLAQTLDNEYIQLIYHSAGYSFPSGHASLVFAIAAAVAFYYPRTSVIFFAAALIVGASRVVAGIHWPSDILAGAIVGIGTAWLLYLFLQKLKKRV